LNKKALAILIVALLLVVSVATAFTTYYFVKNEYEHSSDETVKTSIEIGYPKENPLSNFSYCMNISSTELLDTELILLNIKNNMDYMDGLKSAQMERIGANSWNLTLGVIKVLNSTELDALYSDISYCVSNKLIDTTKLVPIAVPVDLTIEYSVLNIELKTTTNNTFLGLEETYPIITFGFKIMNASDTYTLYSRNFFISFIAPEGEVGDMYVNQYARQLWGLISSNSTININRNELKDITLTFVSPTYPTDTDNDLKLIYKTPSGSEDVNIKWIKNSN
jgi:hypothetical protein